MKITDQKRKERRRSKTVIFSINERIDQLVNKHGFEENEAQAAVMALPEETQLSALADWIMDNSDDEEMIAQAHS